MAQKIVFFFLVLCMLSMVQTSYALTHLLNLLNGGNFTLSASTPILNLLQGVNASADLPDAYGSNHNIENQIAFHTELANSIVDFLHVLVQKKVDLIFWLKRGLVTLIVRGIGFLKYFILNNPRFVQNLINHGAEVLKLILTNKPHFAVPHIAKIINDAHQGNYAPYGVDNN